MHIIKAQVNLGRCLISSVNMKRVFCLKIIFKKNLGRMEELSVLSASESRMLKNRIKQTRRIISV